MKLIQALDFDINLPVSYLFLRRYAKVMGFTMPQVNLQFRLSVYIGLIEKLTFYLADIGSICSGIEFDGISIHSYFRFKNGLRHFPLVITALRTRLGTYFGTFLVEFHNFQKFDHIVLEHIPGIPHLIQKRRTASNCRTVEHCRPAGAPTKTEDYL